jgi:hypothetical protein
MPKKAKKAKAEPKTFEPGILNQTELFQLCQMNDIPGASMAVPRKLLIQALKNKEPIDSVNPIDSWRFKMSAWLRRNWGKAAMQAESERCPNCSESCDVQVVKCYLENMHRIT